MNPQGGFTLLETLVAIAILAVSLAGPISIAAQGLSSAFFAKDQIIAFYLAQEAVEYVRSIRDENILTGSDWLNGLEECFDTPCTVDMPAHTHDACIGSCDPLKLNTSTQLYNQQPVSSSNIESQYTREMTLEQISDDEVAVSVSLSWTTGTRTRTFEIRENMLNWLK